MITADPDEFAPLPSPPPPPPPLPYASRVILDAVAEAKKGITAPPVQAAPQKTLIEQVSEGLSTLRAASHGAFKYKVRHKLFSGNHYPEYAVTTNLKGERGFLLVTTGNIFRGKENARSYHDSLELETALRGVVNEAARQGMLSPKTSKKKSGTSLRS